MPHLNGVFEASRLDTGDLSPICHRYDGIPRKFTYVRLFHVNLKDELIAASLMRTIHIIRSAGTLVGKSQGGLRQLQFFSYA